MEPSEVAELRNRAASGDTTARERLIAAHRDFILWAASTTCRRSVDPDRDDEWSISLIAFNEAIDSFKPELGTNFLSHARLVIRRRLVDFFRQNSRGEAVPLDDGREDDEGQPQPSWAEEHAAWQQYRRDQEIAERAEEIERFQAQLADFGLSLDDLEEASPSHRDTRLECLRIAAALAGQPRLLEFVMTRHQLPIAELMLLTGTSRKILETWRRYLLAVTLILGGDYEHLRGFVRLPSH